MKILLSQNIRDYKNIWYTFLLLLIAGTITAAPNSNGTTTNWNTASGWDCGCVPDLNFHLGTNDVIVSHDKTAGSLSITNGNSIRVTAGATLTISGNLTLGSSSTLTVDVGGTLIITGSLLATNSPSTVTINGTLDIGGNYSISTSSVTHNLNGDVDIDGGFTATGNTNIFVAGGQIDIAGQLRLTSNAIMQGSSGYVTYTSTDITGCGFSYLICSDGTRFGDGNPAWCSHNANPFSGGMDFASCAAYVGCTNPTVTSSSGGSRCGTGTVGISATVSSGTVRWYTEASGGSLVGTSASGATWTTPSISSTTTYYAEGIDGACTSASRTAVTATVNAIPTVVSGTGGDRCGSGTVGISADVSAGTVRWYTEASGGSLVGTSADGATWTTPSISSTTIYYAEALNGSCSSTSRTAVTATINSTPSVTSTTDGDRCGSGTVGLSADISSGTVRWYTAASGGSLVGTSADGATWTTPSISSTTIYYAEAWDGSCASTSRTAVTATVNAIPTITTTTDGDRCGTGTVGLVANASTGTIRWYTAASGGSLLGTSASGATWTTPSISSTTVYYAEALNGTCASVARTAVTATVNTIPTVSSGTDGDRCGSGTVDLSAVVSSGTVRWYDAASGGSLVGTSASGATWTSPSISSTTIYYAEAWSGSCASTTRTAVTATVNTIPTVSSGTDGDRCGTGTVDLSAVVSSGTVRWYDAASGGSLVGTSASGATWTTPSISSTTIYYAEAIDGSCSSTSRTAVTATVTTIPTVSSVTDGDRCGTGTVDLIANASTGTIRWYDAASGGSLVGTSASGATWTSPSISSTTVYYAEALNGVCASASRTAVTATVNTIPTVSSGTDGDRCGSGTVDLSAVVSAGTVRWYDAASGGTLVGTSASGATWTSPSISSTTIYYAEAWSGSCASTARTAVTATVNTIPTVSSGTDGDRCGAGTVDLSAAVSSGTVRWYDAASGGTLLGTSASGATWTSPSISSTTIYYAEAWTGSCASIARTAVTATVNIQPTFSSVTDGENCGPGTVDLSADVSTGTVRWYDAASAGTLLGTSADGATWTTGSISSTTIFYAEAWDGICTSASRSAVTATINAEPTVLTGTDGERCAEGTVDVSATTDFGDVRWYDAATGGTLLGTSTSGGIWSTPSISTTTTYYAEGWDAICPSVARVAVTATVHDLPVFDLGNDTAICIDSTITFDAQIGVSWVWNNGDLTQTTNVKSAGEYFVTVTDANSCSSNDTINLVINALPIVYLGRDTAICVDSTITFDAVTGVSWLWNNGDLTQTTTVSTSGDYDVVVTDINGCVNYDTINLSINELPIVNIGSADTTICTESDYVLDAGSAGTYLWNDGSIDPTLTTTGMGEYSVIVTDVNNCVNYDTIQIDTFATPIPVINIQDTAICLGESVTLEVDPIYAFYAWTHSGSIANTAVVDETNEYVLRVFDVNGCLGSDTSNVVVNSLPDANIGDSVRYCAFSPLFLTVHEVGATYVWNTGGTDQSEEITSAGEYSVVVTDGNDCVSRDTAWVYEGERVPVNLGNDTTICFGTTITLDASFINSETWEGSVDAESYEVSEAGTYDVLVIDADGCYGRDTIEVSVSEIPTVSIDQGDSLSLCEEAGEGKLLSVSNDAGLEVYWNTDEVTESIEVFEVADYIVSLTNEFACTGSDTIIVYDYCREVILNMPNLFTPNGDGTNETFIPITQPGDDLNFLMSHIKSMDFTVLNRWGQTLYASKDQLPNWNGRSMDTGEVVSSGTYFWIFNYSDVSGKSVSINGYVQVSQ